jgi:hypothetical protein
MYLYTMVIKILSAIGEEVRHGVILFNGQGRKNSTNKHIEIGNLAIKLVEK